SATWRDARRRVAWHRADRGGDDLVPDHPCPRERGVRRQGRRGARRPPRRDVGRGAAPRRAAPARRRGRDRGRRRAGAPAADEPARPDGGRAGGPDVAAAARPRRRRALDGDLVAAAARARPVLTPVAAHRALVRAHQPGHGAAAAAPIRRLRYPRRTAAVGCVVAPVHVASRPLRPARELRLVAVGGLVDRKDPLLAVRTVAELRDRGVPARLTWVGGGPLERATRRLARRLGVEDAVVLTGPLDTAGVRAALDAADMFLLPTRGDNFCVSAAEALVHGRPVVVGATGGQGEYIDPAVGRLVAEQTPQAYADAVVDLDRHTQHLTAAEIAATIGDRFAPERIAEAYVAEYRHLRAR